jgi:hypothetical protein
MMAEVGSTLFHPYGKDFSKIVRRVESGFTDGFYRIIYEGESEESLIHISNFVEVNPDTPQNRLAIQLKYSGE